MLARSCSVEDIGDFKIGSLRYLSYPKCYKKVSEDIWHWAPLLPSEEKTRARITERKHQLYLENLTYREVDNLSGILASKMREGRCLDDEMHWTAQKEWTDEEVRKISAYRVRHPVPTDHHQPWPVAVALLQQPFVTFSSNEERGEYMGKLAAQERRIKGTPRECHSVRAGDASYYDRLIHDLDTERQQQIGIFQLVPCWPCGTARGWLVGGGHWTLVVSISNDQIIKATI